MNNIAHEIADYMFVIGTEKTMSGNFCFYFDELDKLFGTQLADDDEALMSDIVSDMCKNHDILEYDIGEDCFDWWFALEDCAGFRRDCVCKLCGEKIHQCNLGCIEQPEWDEKLHAHMSDKHPTAFRSINHPETWFDGMKWVHTEDYFEIGEEY